MFTNKERLPCCNKTAFLKRRMTCKPNSVSPTISVAGNHLSGSPVTRGVKRSTRLYCDEQRTACVNLHLVRFTMPLMSPPERWALTPPFHPYPRRSAPEILNFHLSNPKQTVNLNSQTFKP